MYLWAGLMFLAKQSRSQARWQAKLKSFGNTEKHVDELCLMLNNQWARVVNFVYKVSMMVWLDQ